MTFDHCKDRWIEVRRLQEEVNRRWEKDPANKMAATLRARVDADMNRVYRFSRFENGDEVDPVFVYLSFRHVEIESRHYSLGWHTNLRIFKKGHERGYLMEAFSSEDYADLSMVASWGEAWMAGEMENLPDSNGEWPKENDRDA